MNPQLVGARVEKVKIRTGRYRVPVILYYNNDRIYISFRYNEFIMKEVKEAFENRHWHGYDEKNPMKMWSFPDTIRNRFQLSYLMEENPYARFDEPLIKVSSERPLYDHQLEMLSFALTRRMCIFACEMGTGKTLVFIEAAEHLGYHAPSEVWYVGPKSGVRAVSLELKKWDSKIEPKMLTYQGLVKVMKYWDPSNPAPKMVCFDESSKIKTPKAQRSQAALHLANEIRHEHPEDGFAILMSGTPAPRTPTDWWHQCEVAQPGFLREGNIHVFKQRLCIVEERESITGGTYPHIVTWKDGPEKCDVCGLSVDEMHHHMGMCDLEDYHDFIPSKDEISYLGKRMSGLVLVKYKKDCLDLPEKQFKIIEVMPSVEILRAAKLISVRSTRAIQALTLLRELSDGFQYFDDPTGRTICPNCGGTGKDTIKVVKDGYRDRPDTNVTEEMFDTITAVCDTCGGAGEVDTFTRKAEYVPCPKDDILIELLDEHEEGGRFTVWGGFTGTVDRIVGICHKQGWSTLRVDGRGYNGTDHEGNTLDDNELLVAMDFSHPRYIELRDKYPKLCFVGHPKAGGMALTLTGSPTEFFYSNSFDGEARMQSIDRGHRAGMDVNRGYTIIDVMHLPTDKLVLDNLEKKVNLQKMSMVEVRDTLERGLK